MLGATVWLAQQWNPGTRFALLDKPDSGTRQLGFEHPLVLALSPFDTLSFYPNDRPISARIFGHRLSGGREVMNGRLSRRMQQVRKCRRRTTAEVLSAALGRNQKKSLAKKEKHLPDFLCASATLRRTQKTDHAKTMSTKQVGRFSSAARLSRW